MAQDVNEFWNTYTVNSNIFGSIEEHNAYLQCRFDKYPLYKEMMELYGSHEEDVVLEYGSGPGDDLIGFITEGKSKKTIGVDISQKALNLTKKKLELLTKVLE